MSSFPLHQCRMGVLMSLAVATKERWEIRAFTPPLLFSLGWFLDNLSVYKISSPSMQVCFTRMFPSWCSENQMLSLKSVHSYSWPYSKESRKKKVSLQAGRNFHFQFRVTQSSTQLALKGQKRIWGFSVFFFLGTSQLPLSLLIMIILKSTVHHSTCPYNIRINSLWGVICLKQKVFWKVSELKKLFF